MSTHTITWTHARDRYLQGRICCHASPDANCRQSCPSGCESWGPNHEHALTDYGSCLAVEQFEAVNGTMLWHDYCGQPTQVRNGPVDVTYDDAWGWTYSAPALAEPLNVQLTARERQVLGMVAEGMSGAGIADKLGLALNTVAQHLVAVRRKYGVRTSMAAVELAVRDWHLADVDAEVTP